ncbi:MAG: hypothetical protein K2M87_05900, partial [Muribaculaceae bacterium]|nr:hypothetical protein [Muribaculaceae bacterium]
KLAIVSFRKANYICKYFNNPLFTLTLENRCNSIEVICPTRQVKPEGLKPLSECGINVLSIGLFIDLVFEKPQAHDYRQFRIL